MYKYRSSSRFYIPDSIIGVIGFIGIGYIGVSATDNITAQISVVMVVIFLLLMLVYRTKERTIDIEFHEQFIIVDYVFKPGTIKIQYDDIIELQFMSVHKGPTINKMKFLYKNKYETIRFKTVANGAEFIDFVKWIKSKNDKIKVSVYPPDDYMNHRLQEEYGFNYRKVPKLPIEE